MLGFFLLPLLGSLAAIFLGLSARRDLRAHHERKGRTKATAAVILGLLGWTLIFLAVLAAGPVTGGAGAYL